MIAAEKPFCHPESSTNLREQGKTRQLGAYERWSLVRQYRQLIICFPLEKFSDEDVSVFDRPQTFALTTPLRKLLVASLKHCQSLKPAINRLRFQSSATRLAHFELTVASGKNSLLQMGT